MMLLLVDWEDGCVAGVQAVDDATIEILFSCLWGGGGEGGM